MRIPIPLQHLSTEPRLRGSPLAAGTLLLPRVWDNVVCATPVLPVRPHIDFSIGCFVFGLVTFAFQEGCWVCFARFSLVVGKKTLFVWVGSFDFLICRRPITYTRATAISPCRRRIPSGAARERSSQGTDRSHGCANGLAQTISLSYPPL